jgi:MFS superfamily sulfate permease-like transporter
MIIIFTIRRIKPMIPGALVALILGTIITAYYDLNQLYGVSIVGVIPTGLPAPSIPRVGLSALGFLIGGAAGIVFLAAGETLGTARAFAAKYHYDVDADQELLAMGTANITSGLFGGITIDMSLSNTASGESAGERTQLSSLVSAGVILLVVLFLAPLLQNLPTAVLGAIVLSSILGLFNFAELQRYYIQRKTDFYLAGTALIGVVFTDVMTGLMFAVLLSVVMLLYRASRPYIATLGRRPGSPGDYGDISRNKEIELIPGLVILRLDAPLYFFNANVARTQILGQTKENPPRAIILDLGASADLDIGTSDMLQALISDLRQAGIDLLFSQVRGSVRDRMRMTGLLDHIGSEHIYPSIDAAVKAFEVSQKPKRKKKEKSPEGGPSLEDGTDENPA